MLEYSKKVPKWIVIVPVTLLSKFLTSPVAWGFSVRPPAHQPSNVTVLLPRAYDPLLSPLSLTRG